MRDFGFEQGPEGFGFDSFAGTVEELSGPYIPELRDCMSCGACLGSCPTYKVKAEEAYGPRGRVRLIERVLRKQESLSKEELQALDACTLCRACETVCPSKMAYSELYRETWDALGEQPKPSRAVRLVFSLASGRSLLHRLLPKLIRLYQMSGMQRLYRAMPFSPLKGGLWELEALLPAPFRSQVVPDNSQAEGTLRQGVVGLFTGCVANILDTQTHNATISLLTALGYDVRVVENQTCCGATFAHNGDIEQARICAQQNQTAFADSACDAIIYNSSGCGAFLSEYPEILGADETGEPEQALMSATDILDFLASRDWPAGVELRPLGAKVALHEPCSQRNVLQNSPVVYELLEKIPGLDLVPLPGNEMCCGAGGTKMVTQPELAQPPRDEKVAALLDSGADYLVSSNLSCALHLAAGVREAGAGIEVIHPVELLARQLR